MLQLVCRGRGYNTVRTTRSVIAYEPRYLRSGDATENADVNFADVTGPLQKRTKPSGIVEECCLRRCDLRALESYCAEGPSRVDSLHQRIPTLVAQPPKVENSESVEAKTSLPGGSTDSASTIATKTSPGWGQRRYFYVGSQANTVSSDVLARLASLVDTYQDYWDETQQ
ncbi:PREDICTED: uncharacterized protein LOC106810466 [Priapulus caudatus]|uniref:Uncharacterized protein LOC106810466 n=1 Tax=Priapulus caudatus TaxID=37621 RepID=A0ABM1EAV8_PRICU|nr:PREDICTED: uncharacterized protein LOC106810466 [Priapulus caudatus]